MEYGKLFLVGILQAALIMLTAPLLDGISRRVRARMHSRRGCSIFQTYYDLFKLLKREQTVPPQASWLFTTTPYILVAILLLLAMIIPSITLISPLGLVGDLFAVLYLMALIRFFFSLSGLDSGSTFAAAGSSREMMLAVLMEPAMIMVMLTLALLTGSSNLGIISTQVASGQISLLNPAFGIGLIAFFLATAVETGKLPFDLAEAEQELQEGPLTEYSGRGLALMKLALLMKQVIVIALFVALFLPFGGAANLSLGSLIWGTVIFLGKLLVFYVLLAFVENAVARYRIADVTTITSLSFGISLISFVFYLVAS
ncbi:respiratory chain complex I subunit 1 family protein [Calderihabitans maritimus]|uniref:Respiratory-chain NADH dehydrogenase, subunit 1 n=1 Tax=Calderihabitans maritimus TaxID=1246530 RepID=A0A1Z5HNJ8_9FIRM|nr:NADH-quinone oxidoreductase subunit H [Calderihabitans maritimus]GAW91099.1 respiratory-chain NADH dehydrogenase, subunit 1 [Calderihabitans maritimus]